MAFQRAERVQTPLRINIEGPTGGGKTYSGLLLAFGLVKAKHPEWSDEQCWERVYLIDTERGSGALYSHLGEYKIDFINPPFEPKKFIDKFLEAERDAQGDGVIILDSASHEWDGDGGALDMVSKLGGAHAWKTVTPLHNKFVSAMLQSRCDVITCNRAKMDYVMETNEKGKVVPRKIGIGVIQRPGWEYEWTIVFSIDQQSHYVTATKDRTSMFDGRAPFLITAQTGEEIMNWNRGGRPMTEEEFEAWQQQQNRIAQQQTAAAAESAGAKSSSPKNAQNGTSDASERSDDSSHAQAVENVSSEAPAGKNDDSKDDAKAKKSRAAKKAESSVSEEVMSDPVGAIRSAFLKHFGENKKAMAESFSDATEKILGTRIDRPANLTNGQAIAMYTTIQNGSYKLPKVS